MHLFPPSFFSITTLSLSQTWLLSHLSLFASLSLSLSPLHSNPCLPSFCNLVALCFFFSLFCEYHTLRLLPLAPHSFPPARLLCCHPFTPPAYGPPQRSGAPPACAVTTKRKAARPAAPPFCIPVVPPCSAQRPFYLLIPDAHPPRFDTINNFATDFLLLIISSPAAVPSLISLARHIAPKLHSAAISLPLLSSTTHQHTA